MSIFHEGRFSDLHIQRHATFGPNRTSFQSVVETIETLKAENDALHQDVADMRKDIIELQQMIQQLWYAPPGGGPGYSEGLQSWSDKIITGDHQNDLAQQSMPQCRLVDADGTFPLEHAVSRAPLDLDAQDHEYSNPQCIPCESNDQPE